MPPVDPSWAGSVQFFELLFGSWTAYALLVFIWQVILKRPLEEWRYAMIVFLGASAYWINHYFQHAPRWLLMINVYALLFFFFYWRIGISGSKRGVGWKLGSLLTGVLFTVSFIAFEQLARYGVTHWRMNEFCWMTISFFGMVWLIRWRGRAPRPPEPASDYPKIAWR